MAATSGYEVGYRLVVGVGAVAVEGLQRGQAIRTRQENPLA
jgi:hypothetical protein